MAGGGTRRKNARRIVTLFFADRSRFCEVPYSYSRHAQPSRPNPQPAHAVLFVVGVASYPVATTLAVAALPVSPVDRRIAYQCLLYYWHRSITSQYHVPTPTFHSCRFLVHTLTRADDGIDGILPYNRAHAFNHSLTHPRPYPQPTRYHTRITPASPFSPHRHLPPTYLHPTVSHPHPSSSALLSLTHTCTLARIPSDHTTLPSPATPPLSLPAFDHHDVEIPTNKERSGNVGDDFEFKAQQAVTKQKKEQQEQLKKAQEYMQKIVKEQASGEEEVEKGGEPDSLVRHDTDTSQLGAEEAWEAQQAKEAKVHHIRDLATASLAKVRHHHKRKGSGLRTPNYDN